MNSEFQTNVLSSSSSTLFDDRPAHHRVRKALLTGALAVGLVLFMPTPGHADIFGVFSAIFGLIKGPIGEPLNEIDTISKQTEDLYQQGMWPLVQLNQARGFISSSITSYRGYMASVFFQPFNSATLPGPQQLESVLHSRNAGDLGRLTSSFNTNYGTVPIANMALPEDRVMMDIDDALGEENLKATIVSDQAQDSILQTADAMENQAAVSVPGSTPYLTAQAQVANLRSQAYMQKMLAAELRQEAGLLAHSNALMKRRAQITGKIGNTITTALTR